VITYEKLGVYTVPSKDVTVNHPITYPTEATTTAKAGETCTFGGQYIEAKQTGYVTAAYGAYETKVNHGKTVTETVIKHTTIYASTTGKYEVAKPTTTVYGHGRPSATPKKPTEDEDKYPTYPGNSKPPSSVHGAYPASISVAVYSKPSYNSGHSYGGEPKSAAVATSSKSHEATK
jgi:hypothetical protein